MKIVQLKEVRDIRHEDARLAEAVSSAIQRTAERVGTEAVRAFLSGFSMREVQEKKAA